MRRLLAIAMLCFFVSICSIDCFADTDKDIQFRNLQWGMNIDEVKNSLSNLGSWMENDGYALNPWEAEDVIIYTNRSDNGWLCQCYNTRELKVAGYQVNSIYLFFCYGLSNETVALKNREDSELYMAGYELSVKDYEGTYEDLKQKMSGIYGEGIESVEYGGGAYVASNNEWTRYNTTTKTIEWKGENNTAVRLVGSWDDMETRSASSSGVSIMYGCKNFDNKLKIIENETKKERIKEEKEKQQQLIQEERDNRTDEIDGL